MAGHGRDRFGGVSRVGRSSIHIAQALFQNGRLCARATSVVVLVDGTTRRSTPFGEAAIARLKALHLADEA